MEILIAEDEFVSRKILHKMLSAIGECDFASDGAETVEAFELAHSEKEPYDLICLDINMPKLSGYEVLLQVRNLEEKKVLVGLNLVKIIMTTSYSHTQSIFGAFNAGCEAYIIKPFDREKIF